MSNLTANTTTPATTAELPELAASLDQELGLFRSYSNTMDIPAEAGTRIVKALYQVNKQTKTKKANNAFVRIPTSHLTEQTIIDSIEKLAPFALGWLRTVENELIKKQHAGGALEVNVDSLNLDAILAALEESDTSARLTKEDIGAWFDSSMAPKLLAHLEVKLAVDLEATDAESVAKQTRLIKTIEAYKGQFAGLANVKGMIPEANREAMKTALDICEAAESGLLGRRIIAKLETLSKSDEGLLEAL